MAVDQITSAGLTIASLQDRVATLTTGMETIYGADVNLDPDTPDGQLVNMIAEMIQDVAELIQQVNAMIDPDQAIGTILDARVAFNNIQRQAGTTTVTNITIVASKALTLPGLNQTAQPAYTVQDNAGTEWILQTTQNVPGAGTYVYAFQCATPGAITTVPNTITVPVTIVLGVTSVNNPTTYSTLGLNEETDAALKIRRSQSVALGSQGYFAGLQAALENISGMTYVKILENITGSTNADGVTGHSIWVITAGTAAAASIASAIYNYRNAGCGMVGAQTFNVTQADGSILTIHWDNVLPENLFTQFTLTSLDGVNAPKIAAILSYLVSNTALPPYGQVNINGLAELVQIADPNSLVTLSGFSAALTQVLTLSGTAASGTFKINYNGNATASINWNDNNATIQSKVRAVSGLGAAVVTGTIAGLSLSIALGAGVTSALGLLYVTNNSLLTGGSVAITFTYNEAYANSLLPTLKNYQFALAAGQIVILPMQLSTPLGVVTVVAGVVTVTLAILHGGNTAQFSTLGGYSTLTYSISTSGGSTVNSATGLYTSGTAGTDTVTVTDSLGNTATCVVTVS